jgi:DNA-binding NtrC family response regulator
MKNIRDKSVLIVDDDARMLRALDRVLTNEGAVTICAEWAGDAIDILTERKKRVDLVITDLRMPFVSGMTAVYAIHKVLPELPIIVLTAFGSPDVKAECLRQGATAFLEKPLDTPQLLTAIEDVFASQKRLAHQQLGRHRDAVSFRGSCD